MTIRHRSTLKEPTLKHHPIGSDMPTTIRRTSAATKLDIVLNELGSDIINGKLRVGSVMTLQGIGERFGISRTVAREVMRALEQLGLVASSRRVGITVLDRSNWSVYNDLVIRWRLESETERLPQLQALAEMRMAIEPQAARFTAVRSNREQKDQLLAAADKIITIGGVWNFRSDLFIEANYNFHEMLMRFSGNELFRALAPSLLSGVEARIRYGLMMPSLSEELLGVHRQLAEAVFHGNGPAAENHCQYILHHTTITAQYPRLPERY